MICFHSHLRIGFYTLDDGRRVGKVNEVKQDARMFAYFVQ